MPPGALLVAEVRKGGVGRATSQTSQPPRRRHQDAVAWWSRRDYVVWAKSHRDEGGSLVVGREEGWSRTSCSPRTRTETLTWYAYSVYNQTVFGFGDRA